MKTLDSDVETPSADTLGGDFTMNTGLYPMVIDVAYLEKSSTGAEGLKLHLKQLEGKITSRHTLWVESGDAKGNLPHYITKQGKKVTLPDRALANQIAFITNNVKDVALLKVEEKTIRLYDFTIGAEKPTKVRAIVDLLNKPLLVGMHKVKENKRVKNAQGVYEDMAETRTFNEIHKVFFPDGFSVEEKNGQATEPAFIKLWNKDNPGDYVRDKSKAVAKTASVSAAVSTGSLFDDLPM